MEPFVIYIEGEYKKDVISDIKANFGNLFGPIVMAAGILFSKFLITPKKIYGEWIESNLEI